MKLRRLPEIDLANILLLMRVEKKRYLERFIRGKAIWSYGPARNATGSVFDASTPLKLDMERISDEKILEIVSDNCSNPKQKSSCIEVTKLLMEFRDSYVDRAVERQIPSLAIGRVGNVRYASNFIYQEGGASFVPFFDHRRNGLTKDGRLSAFSMMHQGVRVPDPDLGDVDLAIVQFAHAPKSKRTYQIHKASSLQRDLLSFDQLLELIEEAHTVWIEVQEEEAIRRGERKPESQPDERQWQFRGM